MPKPTARSITQVLADDSDRLRTLVTRARLLQRWTAGLRRHLPAALRAHCAVGAVADQTLVVCADSAAWASKLRFHAPTLLPKLRELPGLEDLQQLRVKVAPPMPAATAAVTGRRPLMSAAGARMIDGCAQAVRDPSLKQALQRLATRGSDRKRSKPETAK